MTGCCSRNVAHSTANGLVIKNTLYVEDFLLEDFWFNGDCFYYCDAILSESVYTVCYYVQLFFMAKLVAAKTYVHYVFVVRIYELGWNFGNSRAW